MVTSRTIRRADCRAMAWRNGQGSTTELAVEPPGSSLDDFDWRLSIAELRGPGPFSAFPGYDRVIVQLDGPPMALSHEGRPAIRLRPLVPHAFLGDEHTECEVDGVAHDLNLIVRRGHAVGEVAVHELGDGEAVPAPPGVAIVHVLAGRIAMADGTTLGTGDTNVAPSAEAPTSIARGAAFVVVASLVEPVG